MIDGKPVPFLHQYEDLSDLWSSDPTMLVAGTLYFIKLSVGPTGELQWRTASALLPAQKD
jgi:hypothetical protein